MLDFTLLDGHRFALLVVGEDDEGEEEAVVFTGTARWDGTRLMVHRKGEAPFEVPEHRHGDVAAVPEDLSKIFRGAAYWVMLTISNLPDDADPDEYEKTWLRWPTKDEPERSAESSADGAPGTGGSS